MRTNGYDTGGFYDEMFEGDGRPRPEAQLLLDTIAALGDGQLERCQQAAERILVQLGITFNVYGDAAGTERPFPFDLVPRIVRASEWRTRSVPVMWHQTPRGGVSPMHWGR